MNRDFGTACSDLVLCITSFVCSQLVYNYSSHSNNEKGANPLKLHQMSTNRISFEPALKSLFYVQYAALFGFVRFALIPRGQLVALAHNLMTVLGQQLSVSLLGLSYFLLTFPKLSISKYFIANFNEIFVSFERTLLILIILAHLLNIQYVDKIIPICFGIIPIIITILVAQNENIFYCGIMSLSTMSIAIIILQQQN